MLEDRLNNDLKKAMLARDSFSTNVLRQVKSAILYTKVAAGSRARAMTDAEITPILQKEAKKRQESADLYRQGGDNSRASVEEAERQLIEQYLPDKLSDDEINSLITAVIAEQGGPDSAKLGAVINGVRERSGGAADGSAIARLAKERLAK